ncbi:MAG: glucodextranase DOMON-like domain-containing protein [Nakamurella sp.]
MRLVTRPMIFTVSLALLLTGLIVTPARAATPAPEAPGALSHFGLARKDCLGTARNSTSKVWYTVANGVLSDVYYPTIDNTNNETLQFIVTDGATFTDLQTRDMTYTATALDDSGMACRVTSTAKSGSYVLTTDFFTDPGRNSVIIRTNLKAAKRDAGYQLYARFDGTINGNGGGGADNAGADDAVIDTGTGSPVPVSLDTQTATNAANRDYATPVYAALRADRPFLSASSGYVGTGSDGLAQLDADHRLATSYPEAAQGNVVQTAQLDVRRGRDAILALGLGSSQSAAITAAGASATANPDRTLDSYLRGWKSYDRRLTSPATRGLTISQRKQLESTYYLSANVLKASEDKTYPGAIVASLASPWGQAVSAGDPNNTYFGSYREVFARDLYESFSGLVASGDIDTAKATVRFLFERQQQADGSMPRNSLINGKLAPDSFGVQLDEVAYPILMARTVGLTDKTFYTAHIKRAADYVVAHGPSFGSERWEEQSGYSPSTIAAEIAGLKAAGAIADRNRDQAGARIYRATADHYQRLIKDWTVTTSGPLSAEPYFIRLATTGDPNAADHYGLGNGGPTVDQRAVIDAGFLELSRLGVLPADDPDIARSLGLVDAVIGKTSSSGQGYYRYGVDTPGTEDGYGDCNIGDATDCTVQGKPWAGECDPHSQNKGSGHLWPVLAGERAEHELATGDRSAAIDLWRSMAGTASGIGLIPEQAWEDDPLAASPFGTQPECASIGFQNGKAAGSASPLTWSAAQFVRLSADIRAGRITELPQDTSRRYLNRTQAGTTVTITAPADNTVIPGGPVTVSGTTDPRAAVDIDAVNTDGNGAATTASTTAGADGSFSIDVTPPAGTVTITVVATTRNGATGFAQRTVVNDVVPGTKLLDLADPTGDDNGPGTYAYPTAADFRPGAYDLQNFQIYDNGDDIIFRVQTANLSPTFGSPLGAQLIDVYAANPNGGQTSTAASYPGRNYTLATPWNRLIEVQGFGQRFIDGTGSTVGSVAIKASEVTRYITFTVAKSALGGAPGAGWAFAVVLAGQDGFSSDQVRGFTQPAQDYQFGVCTEAAVNAGNPLCGVDPTTVPKAVDVFAPDGVDQAIDLNPLNGAVVIQSVPIP